MVSVSMELENEKSESPKENENKERKNVDEFHGFIQLQNDMKTWKRYYFQENEDRNCATYPEGEMYPLWLCESLLLSELVY